MAATDEQEVLDLVKIAKRREAAKRLLETLKDCVPILFVVLLYSLDVLGFEWTVILLLLCIGAELLHWSRVVLYRIERRLDSKIVDLRKLIADIPITEQAQYRRFFDSAPTLTIEDIRQWPKDQIVWLVELCYSYPSTKADYLYLEFKYDSIEVTNSDFAPYRVHGYVRLSENRSEDEWKPY